MEIGVTTLIIFTAIGIRVMFHFMDKERIEEAALQKGWKNVAISWHPFAPGWYFEQGERHYLVRYKVKGRHYKEVFCKTSMGTGVYWRD